MPYVPSPRRRSSLLFQNDGNTTSHPPSSSSDALPENSGFPASQLAAPANGKDKTTGRGSIGGKADVDESASSRHTTELKGRGWEDGTMEGEVSTQSSNDSKVGDKNVALSQQSEEADSIPLSLSFIRKPSRSASLDIDIDRIMKQNTLMNSRSFELDSIPEPREKLDDDHETSSLLSPASSSCESGWPDHPLVRKKSGELLKSSLKLHSAFRSSGASSMPSTPIDKQVHFGTNINVKYFNEKDKPNSISAGNSPFTSDCEFLNSSDDGENCEGEDSDSIGKKLDYFGFTEDNEYENVDSSTYLAERIFKISKKYIESNSAFYLEKFKRAIKFCALDINLLKTISYRDQIDCEIPIFLERCFLNIDKTLIIGQVAVKNLSFKKIVQIKYTLDNWLTITNIDAVYTNDIPRILKKSGYDRFVFQLSTPLLFEKFYKFNDYNTLPKVEFCIKFSIGNQIFWDNNHLKNYTLVFMSNKSSENSTNNSSSPTIKSDINSIKKSLKNFHFHSKNQKDGDALSNPLNFSIDPNKNIISLKKSRSFDTKNNKNMPQMSGNLVKDNAETTQKDFCNSEGHENKHDEIINTHESIISSNNRHSDVINGNNIKVNTKSEGLDENNKTKNDETKNDETIKNTEITQNNDTIQKNESTQDNDNDSICDVNSKNYAELIKKYCFFNGPSTISSPFPSNCRGGDDDDIFNDKFY